MPAGQIVNVIVGSIVVVLAAYYAIYFFANRKNMAMRGRHLRVRERFALSKDKVICLVEAKDKLYLVVITNGGATLLDTFELSDFADLTHNSSQANSETSGTPFYTGPFPGLFNKLTSRLQRGKKTAGEDFASTLERSEKEDLQKTSPPAEDAPVLKTARAEDGLDELYRRIQNKRDKARSTSDEEASDE